MKILSIALFVPMMALSACFNAADERGPATQAAPAAAPAAQPNQACDLNGDGVVGNTNDELTCVQNNP